MPEVEFDRGSYQQQHPGFRWSCSARLSPGPPPGYAGSPPNARFASLGGERLASLAGGRTERLSLQRS
jgi:hypothetical protein